MRLQSRANRIDRHTICRPVYLFCSAAQAESSRNVPKPQMAEKSEKSGVGQIEAAFNALQPQLDAVDPQGLAGEITVERGDLHLQRRNARFDLAQIGTSPLLPLSDGTEMIENKVAGRFHGG